LAHFWAEHPRELAQLLERVQARVNANGRSSDGTNHPEVHHAAPRCLISLHERANGISLDGEGIQAWLEWEWEAMRWRVPVEISRDELEVLVERSTVVLEREKHRLIHEGDWRRGEPGAAGRP